MFYKTLLQSNIIIALGAMCLYCHYSLIHTASVKIPTAVFIFTSTVLAYDLMIIIGLYRAKIALSSILKFKLVLMAVLSSILALNFELNEIITLTIALPFVLFYERILFKNFSLRRVPYFKSFLISLCWMIVVCALSIEHFSSVAIYNLIDCFGFIFLLCIPFDIVDHHEDSAFELKSFSHLFSSQKNLKLLLSPVFVFYTLIQLPYLNRTIENYLILIIMNVIFLFVLKKVDREIKKENFLLHLYIGIDGLIILKSLLNYNF